MKKTVRLILIAFSLLALARTGLQAIGIQFSYFFPNGGRFACPVPPLGLDDVGLTFGKFFGISTGLNLYNVGGMSVKGLPFTNEFASTESFTSLNIPLYLKLIVPLGFLKIEIKGGGFAFYNFGGVQLNKEFDYAYAKSLGYDTLRTTDLQIDNPIGFGWRVGGDLTFYVTSSVGITAGVQYLSGSAPLNIRGRYYGGTNGGTVANSTFAFPNAYLDYSGWVFAIGGEYTF